MDGRLRAVAEAQEHYDRQRAAEQLPMDEAQRAQILGLANQLLDQHTDKAIAAILTERGVCSCDGGELHRLMIRNLRLAYGLKSRYERLREAGYPSAEEIAERLDIAVATVKGWRYQGWLEAEAYDDKPRYLYALTSAQPPEKFKWKSGCYTKPAPHNTEGL